MSARILRAAIVGAILAAATTLALDLMPPSPITADVVAAQTSGSAMAAS